MEYSAVGGSVLSLQLSANDMEHTIQQEDLEMSVGEVTVISNDTGHMPAMESPSCTVVTEGQASSTPPVFCKNNCCSAVITATATQQTAAVSPPASGMSSTPKKREKPP